MPFYVIVRNFANLDTFVVSVELSISIFNVWNIFTCKNQKSIYTCYKKAKYNFIKD